MMKIFSSLRARLFLLLLLFSVVPVVGLGLWTIAQVDEAFTQRTYRSLQGLSSAKARGIEQFVADRRSEVEQISQLVAPNLQRHLRLGGSLPDAGELPALDDGPRRAGDPSPREPEPEPGLRIGGGGDDVLGRRLRLILWDTDRFEELLLIDADGRVVASTHPDHQGRSAAELEYFTQGLRRTFIQPVFTSPITGRTTFVVATPIRGEGGVQIGVLAARLNLQGFFELVNDFTGLGETGEVVLGRLNGETAQLITPTRHDPEAALTRTLDPTTPLAAPLRSATQGATGMGTELDYRGTEVYAAWEPVRSLDAGLVVKIDRAEARQPVRAVQMKILIVLLLLVLASLAASALAARHLVAPLQRLEKAADKISRGDLDIQLGIQRDDEIGDLADSFERMVSAIRYFRTRPAAEEPNAALLAAEREEEAAAEAADQLEKTQSIKIQRPD